MGRLLCLVFSLLGGLLREIFSEETCREGLSSVLQWLVSDQVLNTGNLELMFNPVDSNQIEEEDRTTYIASVGEVIDLDVVLVTASGNIDVSPYFLRPASVFI